MFVNVLGLLMSQIVSAHEWKETTADYLVSLSLRILCGNVLIPINEFYPYLFCHTKETCTPMPLLGCRLFSETSIELRIGWMVLSENI
ncbi:MAG: hypothetical protein NPIRA03_21320 [Nitrospirales bacterium]|nr:MAG: hypothetical protein NPIRA03_21320 [Nitrospirales bacterium]